MKLFSLLVVFVMLNGKLLSTDTQTKYNTAVICFYIMNGSARNKISTTHY